MPVPIMPRANSRKVKSPASGLNASAACGGRIDVGDSVGIEDRGGGQDDGKGNHVGEDHADGGIDADTVKLGSAASGQFAQRAVYLALIHFLDFLRGLPEKQIGAYRGAENRHHHQEIVGIDGGFGPDRSEQRRAPWDIHGQCGRDIGEQRERHEFQHRRVAAIGDEDLQQGRRGRAKISACS